MTADRKDFRAYLELRLKPEHQSQADSLAQFLDMLASYNETTNLTGLSGLPQLCDEMVLESLRLLDLGPLLRDAHVCDLGSGNGSPVVPLALCQPEAHFTAVESRARRAAFLRQLKARLSIANLEVVEGRAEALLPQYAAGFDVVTARAFAPPPDYLALAARLVRPGGEIRGFFGEFINEVQDAAKDLALDTPQILRYSGFAEVRHVYRISVPMELG